MSLTRKRKIFIDEYIKCFNAAEAARRAGYSVRTARSIGQELLTIPDISTTIQQRITESHIGADEVLKLLADMARGDMGEFLDVSGMGFNLDLQDAKARGLTKLIKKVKQRTTTYLAKKESEEDREVHDLEIELYDAQAALEKIGRHLDLFPNKMDVTSGGEKLGADGDTRAEILRKLDSIATATGAGAISVKPEPSTTGNPGA